MRVAYVLIALIIALGALSGCIFPKEEDILPPDLLQPEEVVFRTIEVEKGTIQDVLEDSVTTVSSVLYDMAFHNRSGFLVELDVYRGQIVNEGDVLARLDTDTLEIDIERHRLEIEKIKLRQQEIPRTWDARFQRQYAALDLEIAELTLRQLEDELEKASIIAPVDGEVVFLGAFKIGEFVPGRSIVLTVADPAFLQFEYSGTKSGRISHGMDVEITIDSKKYPARVTMIPANVPIEDREYYRNTVFISPIFPDDLPSNVRIGAQYRFSIHLEEKQDVIVIPRSAISSFLGQDFVQVLENGMRTERDIDLGIVTTTHAEVLSGLEEGELLIVGIDR